MTAVLQPNSHLNFNQLQSSTDTRLAALSVWCIFTTCICQIWVLVPVILEVTEGFVRGYSRCNRQQIEDFPNGDDNSKGKEGHWPIIWPNFPDYCWKIETIRPKTHRIPACVIIICILKSNIKIIHEERSSKSTLEITFGWRLWTHCNLFK